MNAFGCSNRLNRAENPAFWKADGRSLVDAYQHAVFGIHGGDVDPFLYVPFKRANQPINWPSICNRFNVRWELAKTQNEETFFARHTFIKKAFQKANEGNFHDPLLVASFDGYLTLIGTCARAMPCKHHAKNSIWFDPQICSVSLPIARTLLAIRGKPKKVDHKHLITQRTLLRHLIDTRKLPANGYTNKQLFNIWTAAGMAFHSITGEPLASFDPENINYLPLGTLIAV